MLCTPDYFKDVSSITIPSVALFYSYVPSYQKMNSIEKSTYQVG
jgi:hypothetical protein